MAAKHLGRHVLVAESLWGYPLFETIHSIGMAMLIGSLGLINLRVLGFKPDLPLLGMRQAVAARLARVHVERDQRHAAVHVGRRVLLRELHVPHQDGADRARRAQRGAARQRDFPRGGRGAPATPPTAGTKWIAVTSLVFWFGAVCAGRLIAYTP